MKPNDKAYREFMRVYNKTHVSLEAQIMASLTAAYAAQFQSEDYAGLLERLRKDISDPTGKMMSDWDSWRKYISAGGVGSWPRDQFEGHLDAIAELHDSAADALEALLAERDALNFELAARKEWPQARAEMLEELAKVRAERDALAARLAPVDDESRHLTAEEQKVFHSALRRSAKIKKPVEDEELVEIVARAICLNRAAHACNCKENGVCKAPVESLREHTEIWPQARAAISAIRPHIEAAERERCAKIAEARLRTVIDLPDGYINGWEQCQRSIAAAIRSGK